MSRARLGHTCPVGAESEENSFKSQGLVDGSSLVRTVTRTLTKPGRFLLLNINLHMIFNNLRSFTSFQEALQ